MTIEADQQVRQRRDEWLRRVTLLVDEVERWSIAEGWPVRRAQKTIHEQLLGEYQAPALQIRVPNGHILLTPVGLHIVGADGRIDLEAWPTLHRVKLVGRGNQWQVITDSNVPLREPWGRDQFLQLVQDLQA